MIETRYALCASTVLRDANRDTISVIELIEDITPAGFPLLMQTVSFVWNLSRTKEDPARYPGTVTVNLDDEQLYHTELLVDFDNTQNNRQIMVLGNLILKQPGTVRVRFQIENGPASFYSFTVREAPPKAELVPAPEAAH